jgi:hypothetical protein
LEYIQRLARIHNLHIKIKNLGKGPKAYVMGDVIYLDESLPPERRNFAFCHELAHRILNHHVQERLSEEMEQEANLMAAQLLLPPETFRHDAVAYSLDRLKELYPQASWEVIARARLLLIPAILTIFDNWKLTMRMAPDNFRFPRPLFPVETEVFTHCMTNRVHFTKRDSSIQTQGYFVDNGEGVMRVLLWTEIDG